MELWTKQAGDISKNKRSHNHRPWSGNYNFPLILCGAFWVWRTLPGANHSINLQPLQHKERQPLVAWRWDFQHWPHSLFEIREENMFYLKENICMTCCLWISLTPDCITQHSSALQVFNTPLYHTLTPALDFWDLTICTPAEAMSRDLLQWWVLITGNENTQK